MKQLKICRKNINVFFCEWDVKKAHCAHICRRQFSDKLHAKLLLYFKQIKYLDVESKCTFLARRKKPWLAEAANCSLLQEVLLQPQKNV